MNTGSLTQIFPPELMEQALLYVLVFFAATVGLLLFVLVVHKVAVEFRRRRKRRLRSRYRAYLRKYMLGRDGTVVRPRTKWAYEALASLCIDRLRHASEDDRLLIEDYIRGSSLLEFYQKMASSSSVAKRFHAVRRLGFFKIEDLKPYFIQVLMEEETVEVKGAAVWALSLVADREALRWITTALSSDVSLSSKFNEMVYANVIRCFREKGMASEFLAFLMKVKADPSVPVLLKRDMVEACGSARLREASRLLVDFFYDFDDHPAVRIAAVRALGRLESPELGGVITAALFHKDWRIRAQAAKAAFSWGEKAVSHLWNLLYDDVFFVRINAAQSLSRIGEKGVALLEKELTSDDPFVRDTVCFMLMTSKEAQTAADG